MTSIDRRELSELSHRALRFPINARLPAALIVPLSSTEICERAPDVVTKAETLNARLNAPEPGGLFDPALFGPDSARYLALPGLDEADAQFGPLSSRFARIALPMPMLHPLFDEHLQREIAERIGWERFDVGSAMTPAAANRLVEALEGAGLGMLVMREVPVLPPELRPMRDADAQTILYRRVINRSSRLARLLALQAPDVIVQNEQVMVRDAIQQLFENDEMPDNRKPMCGPEGDPLRSIRALCPPMGVEPAPATWNLWSSLKALEAHEPARTLGTHDTSMSMPYRLYLARAITFAMGFDLVAA